MIDYSESVKSKLQRLCLQRSCVLCPYSKYDFPDCIIELERAQELKSLEKQNEAE